MRATGDAPSATTCDGVAADPTPPAQGHRALRRGRVSIPGQVYFVTAATAQRERWFDNFAAATAASRCFLRADLLNGSALSAWVLMPDHMHCLIELGNRASLSGVVDALKSATAREANRALGRRGAFWARGFHDRALRAEDDLRKTARYLIGNPVRAGLVERIGDYPFWNAAWL